MAPASPFAFPSQLKPLKRDLRADRPFDPDDGKTVGDALSTLGVGDSDLFSSIKRFQKQHGLKVDGWMKPNGPTQKTLNAVLAGGIGAGIPQGKDKADWLTQHALPQDIVGFDFDKGEAGRNAPGDLMKVKRGFGALIPGKLGRLFEDNPDDFGETVDMIKAFQRGAGLKESGWMAPGDDTTKAFAENLRRILPQLADKRSEELANVDPGFLWQRLRGERAPKDKSLFPKGYRNWREMKELGETGSKVPHLIDQLAEKNARADLDYKIDSNFKAESQRIHGLTLLRAAEKDRGGDKRPTPEPSEEESSEPSDSLAPASESDSLAPASESDTLTPVPPSDTTETESKEETPAEETPWSLDQVPIVEVKDEELLPAFIAAAREKEVGVNQPIKTSFEYDPNGLPEIGLGIPAMLWNADTRRYELRRDEYSAAGANMAEAQWAELQTYADTLTQWRLDLAKGQDKATAAATVFSALVESGLEEEASDQLTKVLDGLSQGTDVADRFPVKRNSDFLSAAEALDTILSSKKLSDADRAALAAASDYLKAAGTPVRSRAEAEYPPASTFTTSWSEATAEQFVFDFMRSGAYEEMVIAGIGQDNFDRLNAKQRAELLTVSWLDMGHMKNKVGPLLKDSLEADWRAQEAAAAKGETLSCAWPNTFKAIKENPKRDQKWQAGYDNRFRLTAEGFTGCS